MKVLVTGGSGFVGGALCRALQAAGHGVTVLTRGGGGKLPPGVAALVGDPTLAGPWQEAAAGHDAFVNLAGASIFARWSKEYKRLILASRVEATRNLVATLARRPAGAPPPVLVSASAVGYYGLGGDEELDEAAPPGDDFLARVCQLWEAEAARAEQAGARVVRARFGIVLDPGGGALGRMLPLFRLGLGGRLGGGRQWFSWISRDDLVAALLRCLEDSAFSGPVNLTAPRPVRNRELTAALGQALGRPARLPAPALLVRLVLGEFGSVLLGGQRVAPRVLAAAGFVFRHADLASALAELLSPPA